GAEAAPLGATAEVFLGGPGRLLEEAAAEAPALPCDDPGSGWPGTLPGLGVRVATVVWPVAGSVVRVSDAIPAGPSTVPAPVGTLDTSPGFTATHSPLILTLVWFGLMGYHNFSHFPVSGSLTMNPPRDIPSGTSSRFIGL